MKGRNMEAKLQTAERIMGLNVDTGAKVLAIFLLFVPKLSKTVTRSLVSGGVA